MKRANIPAFIIIAFVKPEQMKWSVYYVTLFSVYGPVLFTLDYNFFFPIKYNKEEKSQGIFFFLAHLILSFSISDF